MLRRKETGALIALMVSEIAEDVSRGVSAICVRKKTSADRWVPPVSERKEKKGEGVYGLVMG